MSSALLVAETDFALNFLKQTPATEATVFSPLSLAIALSVLFSGAKNNTKTQIGNVILKGANSTDIESHFGSLVSSIQNVSDTRVDVATRFFLKNGYAIYDTYRQAIRKHFNADAPNLDFANSQQAAQIVNGFVNSTTHGKIPQIVTPNVFERDTIALIVNAIYFGAKWSQQFEHTSRVPFYTSEGVSREVDMMDLSTKVYLPYAETARLRVVKLPYKFYCVSKCNLSVRNRNFAMAVFLPKKRFGLESIRDSITGKELQDLLKKAETREVDVYLPKFHLETSFDATTVLKKLGITEAFTDSANFSLISEKPVKVSNVIHKAVITVDEAGTEAAAATVVRMIPLSLSFPEKFCADEPFLYAVIYKDRPLFFGQFF